jgi:TrmH family RNA methyltransferase
LRRESSLCVAEGIHIVQEALKTPSVKIENIYVTDTSFKNNVEIFTVINLAREKGIEPVFILSTCYESFSLLKSPEGIAVSFKFQLVNLSDFFSIPNSNATICLNGVQDPGNAGTILRTAEAAGFGGVIFSGNSIDPTHPALVRGAMGASLRLNIAKCSDEDFIYIVNEKQVKIFCLDGAGKVNYTNADYKNPFCLVIGSEGQGIGKNILSAAEQTLTIPMSGMTESLNASVAASIVMYEARKYLSLG